MKTISINDVEYRVKIAYTDEEKEQGLQHVSVLDDNQGMLFVYDEPQDVSFWMKDTPINLDLIFIDEDEEVIKVATGYADTTDVHVAEDCKYVLELAQGSGIKKGDDVDLTELDEDDEGEDIVLPDDTNMSILNEKGESQMELYGGERIFSRKHTKVLARFAKKAYKSKLEKDYKALGKRVFKYLDYQNDKEDDFVEIETK